MSDNQLGRQFSRVARAVFQSSTFLGLAMIGLLWLGLTGYRMSEQSAAQESAIQNTGNLARAFEMQLTTAIGEIDNRLLAAREAYYGARDTFDMSKEFTARELSGGPAFAAAQVDGDGIVKSMAGGTIVGRIDVGDSAAFLFHKSNEGDTVFISKPVRGRVTNKWSIHISRRLLRPDGTFDGFLSIAADPYHFVRLYDSIELGIDGYVAIIGADQAFRAVGGHTLDVLGKTFRDATFDDMTRERSGWAMSNSEWSDGIRRLVSYRTLKDYPLTIAVALSQRTMLIGVNRSQQAHTLVASLITLLILIACGLGVSARLRLHQTQAQLSQKNIWFEATLNNMVQGVCLFDASKRILVANRRYADLYKLDPDQIRPGTSLRDILEIRLRAGTYEGPEPEAYIRDQIQEPREIQKQPDGRYIEIVREQLADGGWVTTHEDVTERQANESRITHMALHDALTGAANRLLLHDRVEAAFARLQRDGEMFALILIDLDHFKNVNDTHGHAAGDLLLKTVVTRLQTCVRDTDTLARLGGDEFAILQSAIASPDDVKTLAGRIMTAMSEPVMAEGGPIVPGVSAGIAIAPWDGSSIDAMFDAADVALYRAKELGRGRYCLFASFEDLANSQVSSLRKILPAPDADENAHLDARKPARRA